MKLEADPVDIMIIHVYMPTLTSEEEEVDEMYEVIGKKLNNARGMDYTIHCVRHSIDVSKGLCWKL